MDKETDKGYNGEDLYLQQYYFDDEDGTWKLTKSNTNIVEVNGQNISYMKQTTSQTADEEDGIYQFGSITYLHGNE